MMKMPVTMPDTNAKVNAMLDWMGIKYCRWDVRGGK